jgi:PAS domain S-box-containing protein
VSAWLVPIMSGTAGGDSSGSTRWLRAWTDTDGDACARSRGRSATRCNARRYAPGSSAREDRFRSLVEDSPLVSYIDAPDETATAVYVSPQIEDLIGYTVEEWMGDQELWPRILHPDDRARALAENARHNETGEPFQLEYRLLHRDGHVVWVHDQARVVRDERGKLVASQGVLLDITTRKRADEQLAFRTYHDD